MQHLAAGVVSVESLTFSRRGRVNQECHGFRENCRLVEMKVSKAIAETL